MAAATPKHQGTRLEGKPAEAERMSRQEEEWVRLERYRDDDREPPTKAEIKDALLEEQEADRQEEALETGGTKHNWIPVKRR